MTTVSTPWISQPWQTPRAVARVKTLLAHCASQITAGAVARRPASAKHSKRDGKVFFLPGMMGSRLSVMKDDQLELAWLRPTDIAAGGIARLKWPAPVIPTGALAVSYAQMLMRLRLAGCDADYLPFDWRQSPDVIGDELIAKLRSEGHKRVTLVCHSMGGLVARQMAAADPDGHVVAKVITIGTPNRGSYTPLQMFDLSHPTLTTLARMDTVHDRHTLVQEFLREFPGLLAMLPSGSPRESAAYFDTACWPTESIKPRAAQLDRAKAAIDALAAPDGRFHQIIGTGHSTIVGAQPGTGGFQYDWSDAGDGVVSQGSAEMGDVPRYFARSVHGQLCNNDAVISATVDLIQRGRTAALSVHAPRQTKARRVSPAVSVL
jgi:pimeloyl-ACP methyl ester carboxylesterase